MRDVEQHFPRISATAADLLGQRREHPMHLNGDGPGFGLALALPGSAFPELREVLLARPSVSMGVETIGVQLFPAAVIEQHFQVHLGFAAQAVNVGKELALIGTDGAAKAIVVRENGSKTEGKNGGAFEAIRDNASVFDGCPVIQIVFCGMFADDDG